MIYSKFYFKKNLKVLNYLGAGFLLLVILLSVSFIASKKPLLKTGKEEIKMMEITNLRPIQATVVWQSNKKEAGSIIYGEKGGSLGKTALDDRDVADKKNSYLNHYVTIRSLKPDTDYSFKINSYAGKTLSFKTPSQPASKNNFNQFFGKVVKVNLAPDDNSVVLLYIDKVGPLSALTKDSGEWLIPLNSFYEKDSLKEKILTGKEKVKVEIIDENNEKSTINGYLDKLSGISETIVMAKNYDFTGSENVLSADTSISGEKQNTVEIIYPQEGAIIPGRTPLIKGIGIPNGEFDIVLSSKKTLSAKVTSNGRGEWNYLPPESIDLGPRKVTVTTTGFRGEKIVLTRNFTTISNETVGGKVLGVASGEPTIYYSPPTPTTAITSPITITPTTPVAGGADFSNLLLGSFSFFAVGLGLILIF